MLKEARALAHSVSHRNPDPAIVHEILECTHMAIEYGLRATAENPPPKPGRSKERSRTRACGHKKKSSRRHRYGGI